MTEKAENMEAAETAAAVVDGTQEKETEAAASRTKRAIRAVEWFKTKFPAGERNLPLEIGIFDKIVREYVQDFQGDPEPLKTCGQLLMRHTKSVRYQRVLAAGGPRYTLDGQIAGEITPEQQQAAQQFIDKIKAAGEEKKRLKKERKAAERRKKEEKAAKAKAAEEARAAAKAAAKAAKAAKVEAERRAAAERRARDVQVVVKKRRTFSSTPSQR
jgi:sRNA-binding protein